MSLGIFGTMFDLNGDGHLDALEHATELMFIDSMERRRVNDMLHSAGLNRDELEYMDEYERRRALEDAGLDPDDCIF